MNSELQKWITRHKILNIVMPNFTFNIMTVMCFISFLLESVNLLSNRLWIKYLSKQFHFSLIFLFGYKFMYGRGRLQTVRAYWITLMVSPEVTRCLLWGHDHHSLMCKDKDVAHRQATWARIPPLSFKICVTSNWLFSLSGPGLPQS